MVRFSLTMALLVLPTVPYAPAADLKVDNPNFLSWQKAKLGTIVSMTETVTLFNDKKLVYTHTYTLAELNAAAARVEHKVYFDGKLASELTVTYPEPKQKTLPEGSKPEDALKPKPTATAVGEEKLKIGTTEYTAQKFTTSEKVPGGYTLKTTYWYSEAVVGRLLRKDTEKVADRGTFKETSSQVFTEVKAP